MQMRQIFFGIAILLPVSFSETGLAAVAAETPGAFVVGVAQKALDTAGSKTLSAADRRRSLGALLDSAFDMPRIASVVVGPYWQGSTAAERQAFAAVFRDHVAQTYSERFADYDGATFRVVVEQEETATGTVVSTEIAQTAKAIRADHGALDQPVRLDWLVHMQDGYRIVDITVGGVSMAATKRAEFTSFLKNNSGGLTNLTQRLQATVRARQ